MIIFFSFIFEVELDSYSRSQNNAFNDECFHLPETTDDQLFTLSDGQLVLEDTKVRVACRNAHDFPQRLDEFCEKFVICPTLIEQIAQVFAAASARTPLLLEGGPGIGKTQVVLQVCSLLGVECERMNLSGHTSLEQLIGCFMPRFVNGARVFQWHEGRLISAIRAERWILLDELNLASNDVLQALTPLFYRSVTTFTLHATGERLSLANVRIFATMNPSSTGDGRQRLSRSIKNLFHVVQVEDYSEAETRSIVQRFFPGGQINTLFDLHLLFKLQLTHGLLGRTRAAPDVNLRDLAKFRDVFNNLIHSQLFDDEHDQLPTSMDQSTATLVSLNKSAQIVYACQLPNRDEFRKACELIDETFPIPRTLNVNQRSIDESSPAFVRIGSICLTKGTEFVSSLGPELVHTRTTIDQLELLAAACQSKRTVLIEGDTCSGKTSLVSELARLTPNKLLIIPLHENFQPSDLIGSWLPSLLDKRQHRSAVQRHSQVRSTRHVPTPLGQ